ncbi:MAG: hypothetical protein CME06_00670 [Gemmatimonadetes bacterium]|nr:hypothetical protein [Gemmatimonadota bacterium]
MTVESGGSTRSAENHDGSVRERWGGIAWEATLWTARKPDLLITDVKMPRMDGISLVKEVRQRDSCFPIVVVTAFATPELSPFESGEHPVAVLRKPFSLAKLIMRIESLGFGAGADRPRFRSLG